MNDQIKERCPKCGTPIFGFNCREIPMSAEAYQLSTSIADLVSQIAGQIMHELKDLINRVNPAITGLEAKAICATTEQTLRREIKDLKNELRAHRRQDIKDTDLNRITNSLQRKGFPWSDTEDVQLLDEFRTALEAIAANHGRSIHGIRCRIKDKNVLWESNG